MGLDIINMLTKYNYDVTKNRKIKYIVVHWVGAASTAKNNGAYFRGGDRGASAHYFVDDNNIVKSVRERDIAWAVGSRGLLDQGSPYARYGGKYYGKCTNANSISIEMCCRRNAKGKLYISKATLERTAKLVQAIQKRLGVDNDHVIRHFDVNGKLCPLPYIKESKWDDVHAILTGQKFTVKVKGKLIVRKTSSILSKKTKVLTKGKEYQIIRTNAKGTRGQLADGGWITITSKYVERV